MGRQKSVISMLSLQRMLEIKSYKTGGQDQSREVDPVFLDTVLGDNQWSRRSGKWQGSRMVTG